MGATYSDIELSYGDLVGLEVRQHHEALFSNIRVNSPGGTGILVMGGSWRNQFSNILLAEPGSAWDDLYDAIDVENGSENLFTDVGIKLGGFNGYRYAVNFDGGDDNKFVAGARVDTGLSGRFLETALWDNDFGPVIEEHWTFDGPLSLTTGTLRVPILTDVELVEVQATCNPAPTGTAVIVDVHVNDASIFTTPGDRPTIATSQNDDRAIPNTPTADADDYLTVDIDQIDSNAVAESLTVTVRMRRR